MYLMIFIFAGTLKQFRIFGQTGTFLFTSGAYGEPRLSVYLIGFVCYLCARGGFLAAALSVVFVLRHKSVLRFIVQVCVVCSCHTVACSLISHSLFAPRHFYKPMLVKGVNKFAAQLAVFFLSAFFHEVSLHFYCYVTNHTSC